MLPPLPLKDINAALSLLGQEPPGCASECDMPPGGHEAASLSILLVVAGHHLHHLLTGNPYNDALSSAAWQLAEDAMDAKCGCQR